jgi:hypothetical protein
MENIVSMSPFHFVLQPSSLQHVVWQATIILNINVCMENVCIRKTNPLLNMYRDTFNSPNVDGVVETSLRCASDEVGGFVAYLLRKNCYKIWRNCLELAT